MSTVNVLTFRYLNYNRSPVDFSEDNILSVRLELQAMRVYLDISSYWPRSEDGEPRTVNSVFEEIKGTTDEVGRNTLRLALDGKLDRGYFSNQVKLARLCSQWSGQTVTPNHLLKVEEDEE